MITTFVNLRGASHPLSYRPQTMDEYVIHQILEKNEYGLSGSFRPTDRVIDIGAHIGTFSWLCYHLGSRRIQAFEICEDNLEVAAANLADKDGVNLYNSAVWRSDVAYPLALFTAGHSARNTGDANVTFANPGHPAAVPVNAVALDDIIGNESVALIKIDCESSEWPILLTSTRLNLVNVIVGEFHEVSGLYDRNPILDHARVPGYTSYTIEILADVLKRQGFTVQFYRFVVDLETKAPSNMGIFFAYRQEDGQ